MLVSESKFRMAAISCLPEFIRFSAAFERYIVAERKRDNFKEGMYGFSIAELENPEQTLEENYERQVHAAVNKLIRLDRRFYQIYHEHLMIKLENFSQFEEALYEISSYQNVM